MTPRSGSCVDLDHLFSFHFFLKLFFSQFVLNPIVPSFLMSCDFGCKDFAYGNTVESLHGLLFSFWEGKVDGHP